MTFGAWFKKHHRGRGARARFCREHEIIPAQLKKAIDGDPLGPKLAQVLSALTGGVVRPESLVFPTPDAWAPEPPPAARKKSRAA